MLHSRTRVPSLASVSIVALLLLTGSAHAATRFVIASLTTGANDGSSWANAHQGSDGLRVAIAQAVAGDEVWVAAGSYEPTSGTSRTIAFNLRTGIAIYGGFVGNETQRSERNFRTNVTTLTGDLAGNDPVFSENSFHVVNGNGASTSAILDGFTITGGTANGSSANDTDRGGGLIFLNNSNATIRNCRIVSNRSTFGGGGTYIRAASPRFEDCVWQSNIGGNFGGAIDMFTNCAPIFSRCAFIGNSATRAGGVEIFGGCQPVFTNCLFANNTAGSQGSGGVLVASSSDATFRSCTFVRNTTSAGTGGGIVSNASTTRLTNCVVWGNTAGGGNTTQLSGSTFVVSWSNVQGGAAGQGNILASPLFVDEAGGDYRLGAGSPCIDAGNTPNNGAGTIDLAGNTRLIDDPLTTDTGVGPAPVIDMGAYELQAPVPENCDGIDFNGDGASFDPTDIDAFFSVYSEGPCIPATATCNDIDFNNDGSLFDPCDIDSFLLSFSEGPCTACGE